MDDIIQNYNIKKTYLNESNSFLHVKLDDLVSLSYKINNSEFIKFENFLTENSLCKLLLKCIVFMKENDHIQFEIKYEEFEHENIKHLLDQDLKICFIEVKINKIYSYANIFKIDKWNIEWSDKPKLIEIYDELIYSYTELKDPLLVNYELPKLRKKKLVSKIDEIPKYLKYCILSMRSGDCCLLKKNNKYYVIKIYDITKIYMLNIEKNNYMKKLKVSNSNTKIKYNANIEYQISNKYDELHKNTKKINIGKDNIPLQIEKCLYNMGIGDEISIYENNIHKWYIKLINVKNKKESNNKTHIELYYESLEKKINGNKLFNNKEYEKAIINYNYGLELIKSMNSTITYNKKEINIKNHHVCLLSNIIQSYVKIGNNSEIILKLCDQILKLEPTHYKSIYRKALIYLEKNDTDRAYKYLMEATKLYPNNKYINNSICLLNNKIKQNKIQQKNELSKVFKNINIYKDENFDSNDFSDSDIEEVEDSKEVEDNIIKENVINTNISVNAC